MMKIFPLLLLCVLLPIAAMADAPPPPPEDGVFCSSSGRYCLVSDARKNLLTMTDNAPFASRKELDAARPFSGAQARASKVRLPRSNKVLWNIHVRPKDIHTARYFVAEDGIHYVIDYYGNMLDDNHRELVMFRFYAQGVELNSTRLKTVIRDLSSLAPTASHFHWAYDDKSHRFAFFDSAERFVIRTIENRELWFDKSGNFLEEHPIPKREER
ncbi:MAG: hypothetical protein LBU11_07475 [Zoogloeaceae bacterium]|nr:hypothetical protein [Zoogloeaceae bacterium]